MKTKAWHRTLGAWLFVPVLYFCLTIISSPVWLVCSFLVYLTIAATITVGYHRLFSHNSFKCAKIWHWVFGIIGCVSLNSAPVHWATVHNNHHKFSDTEQDPYDSNWHHFFRFKDRINIIATKNEIRMMKDKMHLFFIRHSLSLSIVFGGILLLFGLNAFLFLYALPVTLYLVTSGLHTIYAHNNTSAQNVWLLEFIIPMCGEWIHKEHHDNPGLNNWHTKPYYFDLGGVLIGAIQQNGSQ
jgi:stearoyl-CoA desaturase (delta-9 desaturase)